MYYKEDYVNGVLCCKYSPNGKWIKLTKRQLTLRIIKLEEEKRLLVNRINITIN